MRVAIVYYSKSGNTKHVAHLLADGLRKEKADVDLIEIEEVKKPGVKSLVKNAGFDLGKYDFIVAGSPVWYGKPAPFVETFLGEAKNVKGKSSAFFLTGAMKPDRQSKALKLFRDSLETKGLSTIDCSLALKTKKGEVLLGKQHIGSFIKAILSD